MATVSFKFHLTSGPRRARDAKRALAPPHRDGTSDAGRAPFGQADLPKTSEVYREFVLITTRDGVFELLFYDKAARGRRSADDLIAQVGRALAADDSALITYSSEGPGGACARVAPLTAVTGYYVHSSRPGRPPKRASGVGLSLAATQFPPGHPFKKHRLENGEYSPYENGHMSGEWCLYEPVTREWSILSTASCGTSRGGVDLKRARNFVISVILTEGNRGPLRSTKAHSATNTTLE
ncbi:hypothetical protein EVAR_51596_1 [Eumeta japonica]|uniref:Uncharacterized protein n=1 Tax=Eumeta variegata TaxID=151549 RepID=A0A4C1YJ62_EUMVA|nr:hypothetical protein EVAR_51596_1 [Eumeta japonica]